MSSDNRKNPAKGKAFQMKAATVLGEYFGVRLKLIAINLTVDSES